MEYKPSAEIKTFEDLSEDLFDPVSTPVEDYFRVPIDVEVHLITKDEHVHQLEKLIGQKYIGLNAKWSYTNPKGSAQKDVSLLQLAGEKQAYIIDMFSMLNSKKLD